MTTKANIPYVKLKILETKQHFKDFFFLFNFNTFKEIKVIFKNNNQKGNK